MLEFRNDSAYCTVSATCCAVVRRQRIAGLGARLLLLVGLMANAAVATAASPYLGLGVGLSDLDVDTADTGLSVDESSAAAFQLTLGMPLKAGWAVELRAADLGEAVFDNDEVIGYQAADITAIKAFTFDRFSIFGRAGLGRLFNGGSDVDTRRVNEFHLALGAGVNWRIVDQWSVRAEASVHDADARQVQFSVLYQFGASEQQNVGTAPNEPVSVPEQNAAVEPKAEPAPGLVIEPRRPGRPPAVAPSREIAPGATAATPSPTIENNAAAMPKPVAEPPAGLTIEPRPAPPASEPVANPTATQEQPTASGGGEKTNTDAPTQSTDGLPDNASQTEPEPSPEPESTAIASQAPQAADPSIYRKAVRLPCPPARQFEPVSAAGCPLFGSPVPSVVFGSDSEVLLASSYPVLRQVADVVLDTPESQLTVVVHLESAENSDAARVQSRRRALIIVRFLAEQGVSLARMRPSGLGMSDPLPPGAGNSERVEFFLQ